MIFNGKKLEKIVHSYEQNPLRSIKTQWTPRIFINVLDLNGLNPFISH